MEEMCKTKKGGKEKKERKDREGLGEIDTQVKERQKIKTKCKKCTSCS